MVIRLVCGDFRKEIINKFLTRCCLVTPSPTRANKTHLDFPDCFVVYKELWILFLLLLNHRVCKFAAQVLEILLRLDFGLVLATH